MKINKKMFAIISLLLILIVAGCGGGNNNNNNDVNQQGNGNNEVPSAQDTPGDEKTYKIGVNQFLEHASLDAAYEGFKQALADEGLKVDYDFQSAQGDQNNTLPIANNFVGDGVDLIFANATPSAYGSLNATTDIPIVFTSVTDPVDADLVDSMENPGGNMTGTTDFHPEAIPNTIDFIEKYLDIVNIGVVYNSGELNSVTQINVVKDLIADKDFNLVEATVSTSAEVKQAAESLIGQAEIIYIITDNTVVSALESVVQVATDNKLPLFVGELDSVERGGFAAYGFDYKDIGYEAGLLAAQILRGEKTPAELPVQYPQNLKLVINKEAANNMGIEFNDEWNDIAEILN